MGHEEASVLLDELRAGTLPVDLARQVQAHVDQCATCRGTLDLLLELQGLPEEQRLSLFEEHPSSEELAALSDDGESLSSAHLARLRRHLLVCPSCRADLDLLERGIEGAAGQAHGKATWRIPTGARWALAAALGGLLFFGGTLVQRNEVRTLRRQVSRLARPGEGIGQGKESQAGMPTIKGSYAMLLVPASTRGGAGIEMVRLQPGQVELPVLFGFEPGVTAGLDEKLAARLFDEEHGEPIWQAEFSAGELWNKEFRALIVALPAAVLDPGHYRVELAGPGEADILRRSDFKVVR